MPSASVAPTVRRGSEPDDGDDRDDRVRHDRGPGHDGRGIADRDGRTVDTRWLVAHLSEPAGSSTLNLTSASITANGKEIPVSTTTVAVSDPPAKDLVRAPDTSPASLGGGNFEVRYLRPSDGTVLGEGTITMTN